MREWNDDNESDSEPSNGHYARPADQHDSATIRAEISETRERLSDTISAIGERLNPQAVKEQVTERVKESIREATIGRVEHMAQRAAHTVNTTRTSITDTIRDNPVPAAMVAIGLGWMLFNGRREGTSAHRISETARDRLNDSGTYSRSNLFAGSYPHDDQSDNDGQEAGRVARAAQAAKERIGNAAHSVGDSVRERASGLADRGRELADRAGNTASSVAGSVSSRTQDVAGAVASRTRQGARRVEDTFYENPLAIGAVTVALGVMAGLVAPASDREVRLMGDARERVADRVKDVAHEAKDKAQHVAERVVDETKRAVREENFGAVLSSQDQPQNPS